MPDPNSTQTTSKHFNPLNPNPISALHKPLFSLIPPSPYPTISLSHHPLPAPPACTLNQLHSAPSEFSSAVTHIDSCILSPPAAPAAEDPPNPSHE